MEQPFPTGSTVPFPYEKPYAQQIDFMDAILTSLRHRHQQQRGSSSSSMPRGDGKKRPRAALMMLESPTGTGKSLSLACAAVAWLRHMEQFDLSSESQEEKKEPKLATNSNLNAAASTSSGVGWLDSWVPPEEQETKQKQADGRSRAKEAREKLEQELSSLRTRLKIDQDDGRLRERRENLARSAVTASKMVERKRRRHLGNKKGRVISRPGSVTPNSKYFPAAENKDYCVEDYHSCDEKGSYQSDDSDNDGDGEKDKENQTPSQWNIISDAASLLNGGTLDGSGELNLKQQWLANEKKKTAGTFNSPPPFSIGGVTPGSGIRKIVYAARTHSQLSQFVSELRRTKWGPTLRVVALGGRQVLCGNHDVKGRGRFPKSEAAISESCLDLQKGTSTQTAKVGQKRGKTDATSISNSKGCPLLASKDATSTLALHILAQPSDIEDAARLGGASHTCAYYASRESLAAAEVVVLPYSMLLSKSARSAVGLSLQESLVIVDEAHNLPEALRSLHSCRLPLPIAQAALSQLAAYTIKYSSRLAGRNLFYLGQLRKCLNAFIKYLSSSPPSVVLSSETNERGGKTMLSPGELLMKLRLDNVNLFKIIRYLERSRLAQKLLGFTNITLKRDEATRENDAIIAPGNAPHGKTGLSKHVSAMSIVQTFLEHLSCSSTDGKIVTDWPCGEIDPDSRSRQAVDPSPALRYVLLHPASHFQNVLEEAHAVAMVGGTLRPFGHVAAELLECGDQVLREAAKMDAQMKLSSSQISTTLSSLSLTTFTCDHVVPSDHVVMARLSTGPTNIKLDFRHTSRMTNSVCDELGRTIRSVCKIVPFGVVVFLPSYSYEAHLVRRWKATGLLRELDRQKKVHREPKGSQQVEMALESYSRDALSSSSGGALLLSVVGGKMSEGINFSNNMARCVMVVGLPYPDITDPELKEKMANMDRAAASGSSEAGITGQAYYQNLCMRAVNQSIGRAIRHANDYAAIVLCDARYSTERRIWQGLPQWVRRSANGQVVDDYNHNRSSFGESMDSLSGFFDRCTW